MSNSNPLNPYFTFRTLGSRSHLLSLPDNELVLPNRTDGGVIETHSACGPLFNSEFDRRRLLKYGCAGAAAVGAFSIDTEEAEAGFFGFFGWVAATAFAAAIGWVVERVLDNKFGYTAPQLRLVETPKPRPTTDDFHNRFSDPIAITNTDAYIETKMRRGWGVEFGLNKHLQLVDDSTKESEAVKKAVEMANGSAMIAGNPRRKVSDGDDRSMRRVSRLYDLDFGYEDVHYVSTHFTQKGKEHKMYCVQKGDRRHLLIDEDAA